MSSREFDCLREFVRHTLQNADRYEWSVQGFGMMRTYIGENKQFRLNVWHSDLAVPDVSTIHDHPWDFHSWIISGCVHNQRYGVGTGPDYHYLKIVPGVEGGPTTERGTCPLFPRPLETYYVGDTYEQLADEIHESFPVDCTITLNDRTRRGNDIATVFWRTGNWVDAKPRPATSLEVAQYSGKALVGMN